MYIKIIIINFFINYYLNCLNLEITENYFFPNYYCFKYYYYQYFMIIKEEVKGVRIKGIRSLYYLIYYSKEVGVGVEEY